MPNLIGSPSFEDPVLGWTLYGGAEITRDQALFGYQSMYMELDLGHANPADDVTSYAWYSDRITLKGGVNYRIQFSFWNPSLGALDAYIQFWVTSLVVIDQRLFFYPVGEWNTIRTFFSYPTDVEVIPKIYLVSKLGLPIGQQELYVDDVLVIDEEEYQALTKRRDIRDAVAAKVGLITIANGHPIEVKSVTVSYRRFDAIEDWPEVQVIYGEESRRQNEMHRKRSVLRLHCMVWAKDDATAFNAKVQCDEIANSIEMELEVQDVANQHLGLGYVDDVNVASIVPYEGTSEETQGMQMYMVDVDVIYRYDRLAP